MNTDRNYPKAKLGRYNDAPAVIISDRKGEPFLWITAANHLAAIRRGIAFCDAALAEHAAKAAESAHANETASGLHEDRAAQ